MKTNRNAFTLIELLAVIVILAIIALIATPIILGIINDAKDNSTLRSAENYLSAVNNSIASLALDNEKIEPGTYNILENGNICLGILVDKDCSGDILKVEIEGEVPISGTIIIEKGLVADLKLMYKGKDKAIIRDSNGIFVYAEDIEDIEDIYKQVEDNNPGIICGEGEAEDYTQTICYIKSIEDLANFSNNTSKTNSFSGKTIELVNNLDFNNPNSYTSGKVNEDLTKGAGFSPKGTFKGTFEGNNKTIKGLYINKPTVTGVGLFLTLDSGTIQNLTIDSATVVAKGGSGILVGTNNLGTIQNINLYNSKFECPDSGREVGGLVGNNLGTIKNIKADGITVIGTFLNTAGLIGYNSTESIVDNIELNNINVVNETSQAAGLVGSNDGTVQNIKASNIKISTGTYGYTAGLVSSNKGTIQNIDLQNVEVISQGQYVGGLIGSNTGELVENVKLKTIKVTARNLSGGIIGCNQTSVIKNIIGNNINVSGVSTGIGGFLGINYSGIIEQIKLTNVSIEGNGNIGGLVGDNRATDTITNVKVEGNIKGTSSIGLIVGKTQIGTIKNVVAKGNIEGTSNNIGGLVGTVDSTSEINANISGVYLSGNLKFTASDTNNRMIGNKGSYSPVFNTLASSDKVTINGNKVESTDISSVDGKTLLDMGKASQSEYEAIGFEFESTDTNECYWYFDENDELDLKIK